MSRADEGKIYNGVFESFVLNETDQEGLVAYALYKRDKKDFLVASLAKYGVDPTQDQIDAFLIAAMTEGQRQRYRADGRRNLEAYASKAVERERPLIAQAAITERIESAAHKVEEAGRWQRQIPAGIFSALIYAVLLVAILLVLRYAGVDFESILDQIGRAPAAAI